MKLKTKNGDAQKKWSSRKVHGTSQTEVFEWRNRCTEMWSCCEEEDKLTSYVVIFKFLFVSSLCIKCSSLFFFKFYGGLWILNTWVHKNLCWISARYRQFTGSWRQSVYWQWSSVMAGLSLTLSTFVQTAYPLTMYVLVLSVTIMLILSNKVDLWVNIHAASC